MNSRAPRLYSEELEESLSEEEEEESLGGSRGVLIGGGAGGTGARVSASRASGLQVILDAAIRGPKVYMQEAVDSSVGEFVLKSFGPNYPVSCFPTVLPSIVAGPWEADSEQTADNSTPIPRLITLPRLSSRASFFLPPGSQLSSPSKAYAVKQCASPSKRQALSHSPAAATLLPAPVVVTEPAPVVGYCATSGLAEPLPAAAPPQRKAQLPKPLPAAARAPPQALPAGGGGATRRRFTALQSLAELELFCGAKLRTVSLDPNSPTFLAVLNALEDDAAVWGSVHADPHRFVLPLPSGLADLSKGESFLHKRQ